MPAFEVLRPRGDRLRSPRAARPPGPVRPALLAACAVLAAAGVLVGCDGAGDSGGSGVSVTRDRPAPPASDFPATEGRTLQEVVDEADPPSHSDPVVIPTTQVLYPGRNRYSLLLADRDRQEITDAEVAIYTAPIPGGRGTRQGSAFDRPARGPYTARLVSLATEPEHRSESTAGNPLPASAFYLTGIDFPAAGDWRLVAMIRHEGKLIAETLPSAVIGEYSGIPRPGERPPRISTPTLEDAGGDPAKLTTREPPAGMHDTDAADALGRVPLVLVFASPGFCQSRVCAPVLDVAEQVRVEAEGEVEFIHVDIYEDNDPGRGVRPQVREFNLPSEPWLFVIGADGVVRTAIEGPFGVRELTRAVEEVTE